MQVVMTVMTGINRMAAMRGTLAFAAGMVIAAGVAAGQGAASRPAETAPAANSVQESSLPEKETAFSQNTVTTEPPAPVVRPPVAVVRPPAATPTPAKPSIVGAGEVTIPATVGRGNGQISLGPVKKGQTVTFVYVRGEWTDWPGNPPGSPDDVVPKNPNVEQVAICEKKGQTVTKIGAVARGTKEKPYVFTAPEDIEELVLNMDDDKAGNNKGEVVYRVEIK
jgi:hypothetical protein